MADDKDVDEKTIAEDLVVTKYKMAGEIVNSKFLSQEFISDVKVKLFFTNNCKSCLNCFTHMDLAPVLEQPRGTSKSRFQFSRSQNHLVI